MEKKKSLFRARMEMPMGSRAAAQVKLPSKARPISTNANDFAAAEGGESDENISDDERINQMPPEPVVGNIVERRTRETAGTKQRTVASERRSRFSENFAAGGSSYAGFPSVKVPLGTFVTKTSSNKVNSMTLQNEEHLMESQKSNEFSTEKAVVFSCSRQGDANNIQSNDLGPLLQSSKKDAQLMLTNMSKDEIQDSIRELRESLSPDTIKFLKKRNKESVNRTSSARTERIPVVSNTLAEKINHKIENNGSTRTIDLKERTTDKLCNDVTIINGRDDNEEVVERKEKERLSRILTSINTYEDLDKAYIAEMERQGILGEESTNSNIPKEHQGDEFATACDLLRSTSKHQNLWAARVVCMKLLKDLDDEGCRYPLTSSPYNSTGQEWPYPVTLPISLRCILDEPLSRTNKGVLHTFVLQSIYALLLMRAPADHVVDVRCSGNNKRKDSENAAVIYQLYYMDDAVPKPSLKELYYGTTILKPLVSIAKNDENSNDANSSGGVYSTSSSSATSATSDGEAFFQDPMWTLLSRMKIIPRLAQILQWARRSSSQDSFMPEESIVSICGILSMIGQRSPGAASAIAQHSTLLHDLSNFSIQLKHESSRHNPIIGIPFFVFLSTLSRQSRVAAEALQGIDIDSILVQIVSGISRSEAEYRLQQHALILWRIMLRYGLCLSIIPTMFTLSAAHLTLGNTSRMESPVTNERFSLSTEFYSCFTVILYTVRAVQLAGRQSNDKDCNATHDRLPEKQLTILSNACVWLSSSKRLAINHLRNTQLSDLRNIENLSHFAIILRFLDSFLKITEVTSDDLDKFNSEEMSLLEEGKCVDALNNLIQSDELNLIMKTACLGVRIVDFDVLSLMTSVSVIFEATACACIKSLFGLVTSLLKNHAIHSSQDVSDMRRNNLNKLRMGISNLLISHLSFSDRADSLITTPTDLPRRHWINAAHAAIFFFVLENGVNLPKPLKRDIGFSLLGRLELGEERTAAILLSYEELFTVDSGNDDTFSILSTMLLEELCRSQEAQKQLDHSFRLHNGPGVKASGLGPFKLDNLLSESEFKTSGSVVREHLLPLGKYWLWMLLSGSIIIPESTSTTKHIYNEISLIMLSTFKLIKELEAGQEKDKYAERLNPGGKLYYIVNICLLPEQIFSSVCIQNHAEHVFDFYFARIDSKSIFVFTEECCKNTAKAQAAVNEEIETSNVSAQDEAKIKEILSSKIVADSIYSNHAVRSLLTLFGDLSDVFLNYGSQYNLFTKCIRFFLAKDFPTKVRCEVIRRLREVLHLLSVEEEDDPVYLLKQFLLGGLPSVDNSLRDAPELLDSVALLFSKGNAIRYDAKLVIAFSVAVLARSIAISLHMGGTGLAVCKRRVLSLNMLVASTVMETAFLFLATDGTANSLVKTTYQVCGSKCTSYRWFKDDVDDLSAWQNAISYIKESRGLQYL